MRFAVLLVLTACGYQTPQGVPGDDTPGDGPEDDVGQPPRELVPSNHTDLGPLSAPDLPDLVMTHVDESDTTVWRIYTDTGLIEHETPDVFAIHRNPVIGHDPMSSLQFVHAGSFAVLYVGRLEIAASTNFEGYGSRPLIVIARDGIRVVGEIDFSGGFVRPSELPDTVDLRIGGPGGGAGGKNGITGGDTDLPALGCGGAAVGTGLGGGITAGGGGGGGGSAGAKGGDRDAGNLGGLGGGPCMTATMVPLVGGGGGGAADFTDDGGDGGGGGGAIQLTSLTAIVIEGIIDVGGKGGAGQRTNDQGGGGGGAGGGILLEAPTVTVSGVLVANGGGGGSGREANRGQQGTLTTQPALGGVGSSGSGDDGRGGNGGARGLDATVGDTHNSGGGGGGGAFGVIRVNVEGTPTMAGATVSPAENVGGIVFAN